MEEYIGRAEHEEFAKRMEDEHHRLSKRISDATSELKVIGKISKSVDTLAVNMQMMLKELQEQGKRLETLESRDGEKWRKAVDYVIMAFLGAVIGYIINQIF